MQNGYSASPPVLRTLVRREAHDELLPPVVIASALLIVALVAYFAVRLLLVVSRASPEVRAQAAARHESHATESGEVESAEWIGKTGLDESAERELPRYLRMQFGEPWYVVGSLRAADLAYIGSFEEEDMRVHYWRLPPRGSAPQYAYI